MKLKIQDRFFFKICALSKTKSELNVLFTPFVETTHNKKKNMHNPQETRDRITIFCYNDMGVATFCGAGR